MSQSTKSYDEVLGCQQHGRKLTVSKKAPWSSDELDAMYLLPCVGFATEPGVPSALCPFMVQPRTDAPRKRELPIAKDVVKLAAVHVQCDKGHLSKDTSLQQVHFTYKGGCADCGPGQVVLHATLKRKA
jgi:hypothetical protein